MAAEFEEIIVAANLLQLQHFRPYPGQGGFDLANWRLIGIVRGLRLGVSGKQSTLTNVAGII